MERGVGVENNGQRYEGVIDTLNFKFGEIVSRDVISDIVVHCNGDLNAATAAMLSIVGYEIEASGASYAESTNPNQYTTDHLTNQPITDHTAVLTPQPILSYASRANTTGAIPRPLAKQQISPKRKPYHTPQVKNIIKNHENGYRILMLMRGVPGSGKSYLARQIIDETVGPGETNYKTHIASTDDYFFVRGTYRYDRNKLSDAHEWNQRRVNIMIRSGISPIIIDNTNIKTWEMQPYVTTGVKEGYFIEPIDANTPWAGNANKCAEKCRHDVPNYTIGRMLENYENFKISGERLLRIFKLSYAPNKMPPVLRNLPHFEAIQPHIEGSVLNNDPMVLNSDNQITQHVSRQSSEPTVTRNLENTGTDVEPLNNMVHKLTEIKQQIEEYDQIDQAWESGDNWTEGNKPVNKTLSGVNSDPKPPRQRTNSSSSQPSTSSISHPTSSNMNPFHINNEVQDWRSYTQFLPPWNSEAPSDSNYPSPRIPVETRTSSTCVEFGDYEIPSKKSYKMITGTPKDINFFYIPMEEKIPDRRMLDKSSMTDENIEESCQCNSDKVFKAFCKMFKNVAKDDLRDIYDKCHGDVNWAAEIVLGGVSSQTIETLDEDIDSDEENEGICSCRAACDVSDVKEMVEETAAAAPLQLLMPKKTKKEKSVSENSKHLKRQIEKNIVLSDDHYSPHLLKVRNFRHGEAVPSTSSQPAGNDNFTNGEVYDILPGTFRQETDQSDDGSVNESDFYEEETVNMNLGFDFIRKLDSLFDRDNLNYSENIVPTICIPLSTLSQINALWMESLTNQLDGQAEFANVLMQQDEHFARELAAKENELEQRGEEPEMPDLKEIMDMEYAMSVYRKDMIGNKMNEPPTIADILSRNKLFAMFPEISQDALTEMLMAHDNNFKNTVEVVLMSLGKTDILEAETGIEKFIAQKEMEQHFERLEVEKKKQTEKEAEFPPLSKLDESEINMETVQKWRDVANTLIENRNTNYQKAQAYMGRGMTTAASYYSSLANMQTRRCQLVNSLAASVLMQVQANKHDELTLDLHHLRVAEALQALDIFIDHHIQKLRDEQKKGVYKVVTLFVITGRGQHSEDGPKIRPATRRRLVKRGFKVVMLNPGLCGVNICCDNKMTHQL